MVSFESFSDVTAVVNGVAAGGQFLVLGSFLVSTVEIDAYTETYFGRILFGQRKNETAGVAESLTSIRKQCQDGTLWFGAVMPARSVRSIRFCVNVVAQGSAERKVASERPRRAISWSKNFAPKAPRKNGHAELAAHKRSRPSLWWPYSRGLL
uniref:Uncharacterized protein n=1 Tax=Romanomermis culicivorax TaxID=13658 RepID=A0A915K535_ROMCU